jgi:hypothetical protein
MSNFTSCRKITSTKGADEENRQRERERERKRRALHFISLIK